MSKIEIFRARMEMADILATHHARSFAEPWDADAFSRMLALPGTFAFVIAHSDETAGFILARVAGDESEVLTVVVDPPLRKRSLGEKLLVTAMGEARARGAMEMFLEVADDNRAALALYRGAGFAEVGVRPGYYTEGGKLRDALTLRRAL